MLPSARFTTAWPVESVRSRQTTTESFGPAWLYACSTQLAWPSPIRSVPRLVAAVEGRDVWGVSVLAVLNGRAGMPGLNWLD